MLRLDTVEGGTYRRGVGHVECQTARVAAKVGCARTQCLGVPPVQQNARAGAGQSLRDCPADATGTARDEGQATGEIEVGRGGAGRRCERRTATA